FGLLRGQYCRGRGRLPGHYPSTFRVHAVVEGGCQRYLGHHSLRGNERNNMQAITESPGSKQRGFTLIEMMIAMVLMTVGLLAVAKLAPFPLRLNTANRHDSTPQALARNEMNHL